jgi:histidinol-phosphate aminotransferase
MVSRVSIASIVQPHLAQLTPYQAGKPLEELARELGLSDAIKLASNENPLGPSPKALDAKALAQQVTQSRGTKGRLREVWEQ